MEFEVGDEVSHTTLGFLVERYSGDHQYYHLKTITNYYIWIMTSIISSFEYDIFISYRHNDNRSGWVTDFVNALQEELASTIKEPLTIYFDKNPHDGLLETHNVDKRTI